MTINEKPLQALLGRSQLLYTADQIRSVVEKVSAQILADIDDTDQGLLVLSVMNGAVPFTAALVQNLPIALHMDYIHASRYGNELSGGELNWMALPQTSLKDRTVLVVDDIYDEGHTLKGIVEYCKAQGARQVKTVVLVDKQHQRKVDGFAVDYVGLPVPDYYVFGFGMDCEGLGRNLSAIYHLIQQNEL